MTTGNHTITQIGLRRLIEIITQPASLQVPNSAILELSNDLPLSAHTRAGIGHFLDLRDGVSNVKAQRDALVRACGNSDHIAAKGRAIDSATTALVEARALLTAQLSTYLAPVPEASDPVPPDPTDHSDLVRVSAYKATVGDLTITVTQSEYVENPRGDNECLGIVAVTTGAGHLCVKSAGDQALSREALSDYEAHNVRWGRTSLPLFLYRHSGERLSTRSWIGRAQHAEWDSGQCGFIYTTAERVQNVLGSGLTFKRDADKIAKALADEVQQLDDWLSGNVWDFAITDSKGDYVGGCSECWGDPGEPDDKALSYLWGEALSEARSLIAKRSEIITDTIPLSL